MKRAYWVGVLAAAGLAGCGQPGDKTSILEQTVNEQAAQLAKLQRTQEKMREELDSLRTAQPAAATVQLPPEIATNLDALVTAQVVSRIEKKLGSKSEIDGFMRAAVDQAIASNEARKKAEQEAKREEERQQWEERRKQFEEQRWTQMAQELKLNDQQTQVLRAANDAIRAKTEEMMNAAREGQRLDPEQMKQTAVQLRAQLDAELARSLSPEQIEAFKQQRMTPYRMLNFVAENGNMDFRRGFGGGDRGGDRGGGDRGGDRGGPPGGNR